MKLCTFTKLTLCLTLLASLASCDSEKSDVKKPPDSQPVTQAVQPKAQAVQPKPEDIQPKAKEEKAKVQVADKKWLPPAMADIGLTTEQEGKLKPIVVEANKQYKAVREDATLDSAAKQEKLRTMGKAISDQYKAILTPEQWKAFVKARQAQMEKNKPATPTGK